MRSAIAFPTPRGRRGVSKLLVLVIVGLLVGAGTGWAVWGRQLVKGPAAAKGAAQKHKQNGKTEPLTYIDMGAFLVNLLSEGQLRYLEAKVVVGVRMPKDKHKAKKGGHGGGDEGPSLSPADDVRARDIIVSVLSTQSFAQLSSSGPQGKLKTELKQKLAAALKDCTVGAVLFTSFVMQ